MHMCRRWTATKKGKKEKKEEEKKEKKEKKEEKRKKRKKEKKEKKRRKKGKKAHSMDDSPTHRLQEKPLIPPVTPAQRLIRGS